MFYFNETSAFYLIISLFALFLFPEKPISKLLIKFWDKSGLPLLRGEFKGSSLRSLSDLMVPSRPIHLNAGFLLLIAWHFSISPREESTLAISYNLLILVFSFYSFLLMFKSSYLSLIFLAASSKLITGYQVTNKWMKFWQRIPRDLSFLYFFTRPPFIFYICFRISSSSSSSD